MKFECMGKHFAKAVSQVAKARSKSQLHAHLQDIYISQEQNLLTLRATDLEISCEKSISVKGIQSGACILKGDTLLKVLHYFEGGDAKLECEVVDGVFSIKTTKGVMEIHITPFEDFPSLPPFGDPIGVLDKQMLIRLLKSVHFCAATTEIKPEIAAVYLYSKENQLYSVATDSFRLAEYFEITQTPCDIKLLIPEKHVPNIVSIISEEEGEVVLTKHENIITCRIGDILLAVHVVHGNFPDYRQLFPKEYNTIVTTEKQDLQKALTLTTFFNEQFSMVKCVFGENSITLHSRNAQVGQVTHEIPSTRSGETIESSYNNRYFLDALPHLDGVRVTMSFVSAMRPMVCTGENGNFTYLLMPLNR